MNIEQFRDYCLSLKGVSESFPFGENTLVFKVMDKVFALTDIELFTSINLKADPEDAIEQRERYAAVKPGYHMNKTHWNTIEMDNSIGDKLLKEWIYNSYTLVAAKLNKANRQALEAMD